MHGSACVSFPMNFGLNRALSLALRRVSRDVLSIAKRLSKSSLSFASISKNKRGYYSRAKSCYLLSTSPTAKSASDRICYQSLVSVSVSRRGKKVNLSLRQKSCRSVCACVFFSSSHHSVILFRNTKWQNSKETKNKSELRALIIFVALRSGGT